MDRAALRHAVLLWLLRPLLLAGALGLLIAFALGFCSRGVLAHDHQQPGLDQWYGQLTRENADGTQTLCCNQQDCHPTEAEIRSGEWWARLGKPYWDGPEKRWELLDYVKIPGVAVLTKRNLAGEAVICHSLNWVGEKFETHEVTIYCFVPVDLS